MKKEEEKTKFERFEEIYRLNAEDVYKVCHYYLKDKKKAQELMQQVFEDFYRHFDDVTPDHAFGYMVSRAKCLMQEDRTSELVVEQREVTA